MSATEIDFDLRPEQQTEVNSEQLDALMSSPGGDEDAEAVEATQPSGLISTQTPAPEEQAEPAQAEEEAPAAEAAEEAAPEETPSRANQRIQQEIAKRKELEAQIQKMEERFQQFSDRLTSQQAPAAAPEPEIPSYDEDPAAHLLAKQQQLEAQIKAQQDAAAEQQKVSQEHQQVMALASNFQSAEAAYAKEEPAYYEAADWLRNSRVQQYQALGYTDQEAESIVSQEVMAQLANMAQRGRSAPEAFFEMAKLSGFKSAKTEPVPNIEQIKENVSRSRSMGSRGGGRSDRPSLAELANMSDSDIAEYLDDPAKWKALWG